MARGGGGRRGRGGYDEDADGAGGEATAPGPTQVEHRANIFARLIVQKLNDALAGSMNLPSVQAKLQDIGVMVVAPERRSPAYLQNLVESEIQKWAGIVREKNIRVDQ